MTTMKIYVLLGLLLLSFTKEKILEVEKIVYVDVDRQFELLSNIYARLFFQFPTVSSRTVLWNGQAGVHVNYQFRNGNSEAVELKVFYTLSIFEDSMGQYAVGEKLLPTVRAVLSREYSPQGDPEDVVTMIQAGEQLYGSGFIDVDWETVTRVHTPEVQISLGGASIQVDVENGTLHKPVKSL